MKYTATAPVTLPAGAVLGLSKTQAADRQHALDKGPGKGLYTAKAPVQFKAGESFDYAGDLPKALAVNLEAEAQARAAAAAKAKQAEDDKAAAEKAAADAAGTAANAGAAGGTTEPQA